jgi:hypothetical protein
MTTDNTNMSTCGGDTTPNKWYSMHFAWMCVWKFGKSQHFIVWSAPKMAETQKSLPADTDDSHNRKLNQLLLALECLYLKLWGTLEHLKHLLNVKQQWLSSREAVLLQ